MTPLLNEHVVLVQGLGQRQGKRRAEEATRVETLESSLESWTLIQPCSRRNVAYSQ